METPNSADIYQEAYDHLQAILRNVPDRIYVKDTQSRFLSLSQALVKRLGLQDASQAIGKSDADFHTPERALEYYQDEQRIMHTGEPLINKIERQILPDGKVAWTSTTKVPLRDRDGKVIGIVGINRDMTAQKEAEEGLRRSRDELEQRVAERTTELAEAHNQLEAMLENIPDRIYVKDTQSRFLKISQALAKRMGVDGDPKQAIGKTDFDYYAPEKAKEFFEDEQRILSTNQPLINKIEKQIRADGTVAWASVTKVPLRDRDGKVFGLVGINRDITAQKEAEEALRKSRDELELRVEERMAELSARNNELQKLIQEREKVETTLARERSLLRTLIDHLPDAIYAKDTKGCKTLANPADLKNLRCKTEAEAIGKSDFDLFPKEIAEKFFADDQAVISGNPVHNREEYFIDDLGKRHWLLTSKLPVRDSDGKIVGLVGIGRDISPLKEAEQKLEAVHKELMDVSRQAGMAEVATGVLHNVGNVLNSVNVAGAVISEQLRSSKISGVSKLAKVLLEHQDDIGAFMTQDKRGREVPVYLKQLGEHLEQERLKVCKEMDGLTSNIDHIKEIVATQQTYAKKIGVIETVELPNLIADALRIHSGAYERHGITLVKDFEQLPPISVDKHKALQIIVNLFSNAKYACDGGTAPKKQVTVRIQSAGKDKIQIEVEDNGMGIPPEIMPKIFSQGFTTRKAGHGFGLHSGVLTAKELGGALTVHSDGAFKGARFTLTLPTTPPAEEKTAKSVKV